MPVIPNPPASLTDNLPEGFSTAIQEPINFTPEQFEIVNLAENGQAFNNPVPSKIDGISGKTNTLRSELEAAKASNPGDTSLIDEQIAALDDAERKLQSEPIPHPLQNSSFINGSGYEISPGLSGVKGYSQHVEKNASQIMSTNTYGAKIQQARAQANDPLAGPSNVCDLVGAGVSSLLGGLNTALDAIASALDAALQAIGQGISAVVNEIGKIAGQIDSIMNQVFAEIETFLNSMAGSAGLFPGHALPGLNNDPCASLAIENAATTAMKDTLAAQEQQEPSIGEGVGTPGVL